MKQTLTLTGIAFGLIALGGQAQANLLVNGDFEDMPNFGVNGDGSYSYLTGSQVPGWTVAANHAVTIHKNPGAYPTISGTYSLNTDGEGLNGLNCDISQEFATVAGANYTLSYDWLGWNQNISTLDVQVLRVSDQSVVLDDQHDWDNGGVHNMSLSFAGDGSTYAVRVFMNPGSGGNDNGFIVDNFSVEGVPEPASIVVIGAGLLALKRRRSA